MVGGVNIVLFEKCDRCNLIVYFTAYAVEDDVDGNDYTTFSVTVQYQLDLLISFRSAILFDSPKLRSLLHQALYVICSLLIEFSHKYTKLAMLTFLYCFIVKGKLISVKSLPSVGTEPATLRP